MNKFIKVIFTIVSALSFLSSLLFLWFFKVFHLACPEEFNSEGRCFDPGNSIVYHEESFHWLPSGLFMFLLAVCLLILSRRMSKAQARSTASHLRSE